MTTWSMSATFASLSEQLQIPAALRENHRLASSRRRFRLFRLALREFTHGRLPLSLDGRLILRVHLPRAHLEVHEQTRHVRRRDSSDAARLPNRRRLHLRQLLLASIRSVVIAA